MPKYDAFGREIGEDTLEGLGGSRPEPAKPAEPARPEPAEPADEEQRRRLAAQLSGALQQAAATRAATGPTVTVRRSGSAKGCLIAIVVVLLLGAAAIAGVVSLVSSIDLDTSTGGGTITTIRPEGPKPEGLGEGSLMRRAAVAAALAKLRADEGTKLTNLRLAPERIDATLLTREGRLRHVQVQPGGKLVRFGSDSGPGFDSTSTIPYARLRPGAPQRLARRGAQEIGVPVSTVQYAVPTFVTGELTWAVYFEHARYVLGDASGRFVRKYP